MGMDMRLAMGCEGVNENKVTEMGGFGTTNLFPHTSNREALIQIQILGSETASTGKRSKLIGFKTWKELVHVHDAPFHVRAKSHYRNTQEFIEIQTLTAMNRTLWSLGLYSTHVCDREERSNRSNFLALCNNVYTTLSVCVSVCV